MKVFLLAALMLLPGATQAQLGENPARSDAIFGKPAETDVEAGMQRRLYRDGPRFSAGKLHFASGRCASARLVGSKLDAATVAALLAQNLPTGCVWLVEEEDSEHKGFKAVLPKKQDDTPFRVAVYWPEAGGGGTLAVGNFGVLERIAADRDKK